MEEQKEQITQPEKKKSGIGRVIRVAIVVLLLLLIGLPLSLYIPPVQDVVCRAVVSYLNKSSEDLEYKVGKVRIGFPLKLKVKDVDVLKRKDGTTLVHVGELSTGLDDIPISQPFFVLGKVHVEDVVIGMDSLTESFGMAGTLKSLDAERLELDLANNQIRLKEGALDSPDVRLYLGPSPPDSIDEESSGWHVTVGKVAVKNGRVGLDMSDESLAKALASVSTSPYLDYNHLLVSGIDLEAENIAYSPDVIHADVKYLKAREENSGLEVTRLAANFNMEDDLITLHEVDLGLGNDDYLQGDAELHLGMLDSIRTGYVDADLVAQIDSANLCRLAAPYLPGLQKHWVNERASLVLKGRVTPDSLDLQPWELPSLTTSNDRLQPPSRARFAMPTSSFRHLSMNPRTARIDSPLTSVLTSKVRSADADLRRVPMCSIVDTTSSELTAITIWSQRPITSMRRLGGSTSVSLCPES